MADPAAGSGNIPTRYRLVVEGELEPEWSAWFEAQALRTEPGRTRFEVQVTDQAQLQGVLRRVHALHLPLVSVTRLDPESYSQGGRDDAA